MNPVKTRFEPEKIDYYKLCKTLWQVSTEIQEIESKNGCKKKIVLTGLLQKGHLTINNRKSPNK